MLRDVLDHDAVRRLHVPVPPERRLPGAVPGRGAAAGRRHQSVRLPADRSRHVELPDDEADAALDRARARLRAAVGGRSSTRQRRRSEAQDRLGPQVDRHVESGLQREVREQRADAAVLQELADQHLQRGASRRRRPARRADRRRHPDGGARPAHERRELHADARHVLRHAARADREERHRQDRRVHRRCCASSRS